MTTKNAMQIMEHFKGLLFTILTYATGTMVPFFESDQSLITTWILQNAAFSITIILGLVSIFKTLVWFKDRHHGKKTNTEEET